MLDRNMKISVDPVSEKPDHSISKKDISAIWPLIPDAWKSSVQTIRLCNQLNTPAIAKFDTLGGRLNIFGRGKDKKTIVWAVLTELVLNYSMTHPTPLRKLSVSQKKKIDTEIMPLLAQILKKLKESNAVQRTPLRVVTDGS